MAKNAVTDWSTTAASNTDVGGIGIQGTNSPANLDDAIREVMKQIADWRLTGKFGTQLLGTASSSVPYYAFTETLNDSGIGSTGNNNVYIMTAGTRRVEVDQTSVTSKLPVLLPEGSATDPALAFEADDNTGIYSGGPNSNILNFVTASLLQLSISKTEIASTVPFQSNAGSVSAPSHSFSADPDTGMYRVGANSLGFTTGGTLGMRLNSSSQLLVGGISYGGTLAEVGFNLDSTTGKAIVCSSDTTDPVVSINGRAGNFYAIGFYRAETQKGYIRTTTTGTEYNTTSDERLKNFTGPYDPEEAVAIIRADPVRHWNWKDGSGSAVGWGAQTSHSISPDLASPGNDIAPGQEGHLPWGVDQGRRTPYLWAALSWALDKIDELESRLSALE